MSSSANDQAGELRRRTNRLTITYVQQALDDLENLPVVSTDPRAAAQRAESWSQILDTLARISDQLERVRSPEE